MAIAEVPVKSTFPGLSKPPVKRGINSISPLGPPSTNKRDREKFIRGDSVFAAAEYFDVDEDCEMLVTICY